MGPTSPQGVLSSFSRRLPTTQTRGRGFKPRARSRSFLGRGPGPPVLSLKVDPGHLADVRIHVVGPWHPLCAHRPTKHPFLVLPQCALGGVGRTGVESGTFKGSGRTTRRRPPHAGRLPRARFRHFPAEARGGEVRRGRQLWTPPAPAPDRTGIERPSGPPRRPQCRPRCRPSAGSVESGPAHSVPFKTVKGPDRGGHVCRQLVRGPPGSEVGGPDPW